MEQFSYYTPTKVVFGKGAELKAGEMIRSYGFKKVLLHYGGGSIKKSGLYDKIVASLKENGIELSSWVASSRTPSFPLQERQHSCVSTKALR